MNYFIFASLLILCSLAVNSAEAQPPSFDSLAREISGVSFSNRAKAFELLGKIYQIADHDPDSIRLRARCLVLEADLEHAQGIYDSTLNQRIYKEMRYSQSKSDPWLQGVLDYSLAMHQLIKGDLSDAFTRALNALTQFKKINDSLLIAKSLNALGRIAYKIESFQLAEDYFVEARRYVNPPEKEHYQIGSNIFVTWIALGRAQMAMDSMLHLAGEMEKKRYPDMLALGYLNIGALYFAQQENEKAYQYFMKAKAYSDNIDNEVFSFSLYQNLGEYYTYNKDYQQAYQNFMVARQLALHAGNVNLISTCYLALSTIHEKLHHLDSAYYYLTSFNALKNQSMKNSNLVEAYRAYISVFLETTQKELIIKDQEMLLNKRRYIVAIISAIGVIIFIASFLVILQQQKRHIHQQSLLKEAENRDLEERLQAKQEIEKLQKEKIAAQVRELTSYSLALSNKNNILQQIATAIDRDDKNATNEIRQVIKNNLNTDKVWKDFVVHFNKVHPEFFNRIKAVGADLSENDLRLCAYLRIGMSTKQIAQMLNVSPESIRMHRYRVKKKLGLTEDQNLDDFIRNI